MRLEPEMKTGQQYQEYAECDATDLKYFFPKTLCRQGAERIFES